MELKVTVSPKELLQLLIAVANKRTVFIWGQPGIGKTALVKNFASQMEMECVPLVASQIAPEDVIGVPQITDNVTHFRPPSLLVRNKAFVIFLDDYNAGRPEVQKALWQLVFERRTGENILPEGTIVIGACNRSVDNAQTNNIGTPLINRALHVELKVSHREWLEWAMEANLHPYVLDYIRARPTHLVDTPPKHEVPFSTPRSWHILSDALYEFGQDLSPHWLEVLARGTLSPEHASSFVAFVSRLDKAYDLDKLIKGDLSWPLAATERDALQWMVESLRDRLIKELPPVAAKNGGSKQLAFRAKSLIRDLAKVNPEMAQLILAKPNDDRGGLPSWFMAEIARDLPRLVTR